MDPNIYYQYKQNMNQTYDNEQEMDDETTEFQIQQAAVGYSYFFVKDVRATVAVVYLDGLTDDIKGAIRMDMKG